MPDRIANRAGKLRAVGAPAGSRVRPLLAVVALLFGASALSPAQAQGEGYPGAPQAPQGAPNVIVIMTDDVGYASASTFGGVIPTPTMDRLAANGLRYANFHTTGLCSPSRAALLTGRNHHAVGTGTVSDLARAQPGYTTIIPKSAATLAQVLKANGYDTAAFGKNHNVPTWQAGPLGPFDQWMSGLGFDYFFGFHAGYTNQFAPDLIENNSMVQTPAQPGYIFDRDMADRAVQWLQTQRTQGAGKPFFLYYAPGTAHAPLHAPAEWMAKFRGKFDEGWDVLRARIFARQKRLGVIAPHAKLASLPPEVKPWASLSVEEQRVSARLMEAYAAALAYCDDQMGRLLRTLEESGQLENTLVIYVQGDNGATPEGGENGMLNYVGRFLSGPDAGISADRLESIGGPHSYPVAPLGWMMAMNTPFPYHKVVASRLGGVTNGMVVSWPKGIAARGVRRQFTHLVDIMPTVLEAARINAPESVNGVAQSPFDGISMAYSFADAQAQERHRRQYFEIFGHASYYEDGWLVASPVDASGIASRKPAGLAEMWELYDLRRDPTQTVNVAARHPEKLRAMRAAFEAEAVRNKVHPLSADNARYLMTGTRPEPMVAAGRYTFHPSLNRYPRGVFPSINNRSWTILADLEVPTEGASGTVVTQGGRFSGWGLVMPGGVPTFLYRSDVTDETLTRLAAPVRLAPGARRVEVAFAADGPGIGKGGTLTMKVDGGAVASARMGATVPLRFAEEDATVGWDGGTPLTDDYETPAPARGLRSVTIELGPLQLPQARSGG